MGGGGASLLVAANAVAAEVFVGPEEDFFLVERPTELITTNTVYDVRITEMCVDPQAMFVSRGVGLTCGRRFRLDVAQLIASSANDGMPSRCGLASEELICYHIAPNHYSNSFQVPGCPSSGFVRIGVARVR